MRRMCVLIAVVLFVTGTLWGQVSGYTDSFDGEMRFTGPPTFGFDQNDGVLNVHVRKQFSARWQGVTYTLGDTLDLSGHPFLNLKLKADTPFLLTVSIVDADDNNMAFSRKVYASDTWVTLPFDFSADRKVDKTRISKLILAPNGNTHDALQAELYLDELTAGEDAAKLAGIGAMGALTVFTGTTGNRFEAVDLTNADSVGIVSVQGLLENLQVSEVTSRVAQVSFDAADTVATDTLILTAFGAKDYTDNTIRVPVTINGNQPPILDAVADQQVMAGDTTLIRLTGISDGNPAVEQPVLIHVTSSNQAALPDSLFDLNYNPGDTQAMLGFKTLAADSGITVTLHLNDQYAQQNTCETSFDVRSWEQINHQPQIDFVPDQYVYLEHGQQSLILTGINDGDDGTQTLDIQAQSSVDSVISQAFLNLVYTQGSDQAKLMYTPSSSGTTEITLTLNDDGGAGFNNGDASTVISFEIQVGTLPLTGHAARMTDLQNWGVDDVPNTQVPEIGSFHGKDNVLKIQLKNKPCWTGTIYFTPDLNVNEHRYLSYDIYFEGGDFHIDGAGLGQGLTHCYFYDDGWDSDLDRNVDAAHDQRKRVYEQQWQTVLMDFRGKGGMNNAEGQPIDVRRIQKVLLNYASEFTWPFPHDNGTVYIANLRLGSAVPDSLVPEIEPACGLDPVPDQVFYQNSGAHTLTLTGITSNVQGVEPEITAMSTDTSIIMHPELSPLQGDSVLMTVTPAPDQTGYVQIILKVSAEGARSRTRRVDVNVINDQSHVSIKILRDTLFQEIRGFGTFQFEGQQNYIDWYTEDLGASAVRTGLISNQIEPVNDNNDPDVLNLNAFDKSAFDFDYYRELQARGVETFILTSWSPPAWMKRNLSVAYGYASAPHYAATDNVLEPYYYDEFAESLVAAVESFRDEAGVHIDAVGPQNEPAFTEPYASAVFDPTHYTRLMRVVGARFAREGLATQLYMPEQVFTQSHYSMQEYVNSIKNSSTADRVTGIIATHGYGESGVNAAQPSYAGWQDLWQQSQSCAYEKELWMTETYPEYKDWNSALSLAGAIHGALVYGNVSLWTLWNIEGTLMDKNEPTASFYTSKNYYKYIRPGARRARIVDDHDDILASGFIHPDTKQQTIVIINKGSEPLSIRLTGGRHAETYDTWTTAEHLNFEYRGITSGNGSVALPARSVTTLVGSISGDVVVAVDEKEAQPTAFRLHQNYPNPFNPVTRIRFQVPETAQATLMIYNILGQKVRTLLNRTIEAGEHQITWDGSNDYGLQVGSGVYFYQIRSGDRVLSKKCILLR
ncbi:MAG: T9SS type A sorting domain-containing protein [candidate division KSB1 bacterium]|nr:T9SS type A sorting domain-containing protein [candidate division KSB1 bacterium]